MTIDERIEALTINIESLHSSANELHGASLRHDAQIEALAVESRQVLAASRQDGENIRALARIAEIHERRLSAIEGPEPEP